MEFSSQKIFKNNQIQKRKRVNQRKKMRTMITRYYHMEAMNNSF